MTKPSTVAKEQEKAESSKTKGKAVVVESEAVLPAEFEKTLRRLVNAVFDLQKDISKMNEQVTGIESNIELLRNQFQEFAEKTQQQLGVLIPAKQFMTPDESKSSDIEADIKALLKEAQSVEQLIEHIEQRHTSGAIPEETYKEQIEKLNAQIGSISKKIEKKQKELEQLKN